MHLKNMHRYFFEIDTFSLSSHRISPNFRANEWENLFSRNECSRKCGNCAKRKTFAEFSCRRVRKFVFTQRAPPKMLLA